MNSRLGRLLAGASLAVAIPAGAVGILKASVAGATAVTNHVKASFSFHNVAKSFTGGSTCPTTAVTSGALTVTCTTTSSGGTGLPSSSTTTFHSPSGDLTYNSSTRTLTMTSGVYFRDTFGSKGYCDVSFTGGLHIVATRTTKKIANKTHVDTKTAVTVSGTASTGYCTTIHNLLSTSTEGATTAYFTITLKFTTSL
jgi:hypothetical protein